MIRELLRRRNLHCIDGDASHVSTGSTEPSIPREFTTFD